jgi:alpha-L-fucosidase 2
MHKKQISILVSLLIISISQAQSPSSGPTIDEDVPARGIYSLRPAPRWEEGLLIGNGTMGGVIYGKPGDCRVGLTHALLGIPDHKAVPPPDLSSILPEIRRLIREGKGKDAASLAWEKSREINQIQEKLIWTDPFVNAANLRISVDGADSPRAFRRSLDYSTGLARTQWTDNDTRVEQRAFMSRGDNLLVLQLTARGGKKLNGRVLLEKGEHGYANRLQNIQEPKADGNWLSCRFGFTLNNGGYEVLAFVSGDGVTPEGDGALRFSNTSSVTVFLRIQLLKDYSASKIDAMKEDLTRCSKETFEALLARHVALHGTLYGRETIDLGGDPQERTMPAEALWEKTYGTNSTPALLERVFDAGRYAILSSTGYGPPNLQGIWAVGGCAWRGDFTHNGNVPTAIGNLLNGNMPELMLAYTGYLESLMDHHRANAKQLYGARGIMLASRTHVDGYNLHYNNAYPHEFWVAGAPWAAGFFYDYYLYTGDEEFLKKHALPWMEQCALFFEDFLVEDANGTYEFLPGYSPEIGAGMNATMDVAAVRQLLRNLIQAYTLLGLDKQKVATWEKMLAKMPKYRINSKGSLAEWIDPRGRDQAGHRHCSHFLPLWFGLDPAIAGDPQLLEAARKAVREKAAARKSSGIMAFGTALTGWAAASLGDGETVDILLDNLSTRFYYPTFASSHNAEKQGPEIFNADISGGVPALMIEMLVQSQPGELTLLSALPERLKAGTLKGALCRGQVTINELTWSPTRVKVNLQSPKDQELKLRVKMGDAWKTATLRLTAGKPAEQSFEK